jgi:flagella basal body P-ring formation protein FlgA
MIGKISLFLSASLLAFGAAAPVGAVETALAGGTPPVLLRPQVTVGGPDVRIGDVFTNAGAAAAAVFARSPQVGQPLILDALTLHRLARGYGLAWQPGSPAERAVVERASTVVDAHQITTLVQQELAARGLEGDDLYVELAVPGTGMAIPAEATVGIERFAYTPTGRRFTATVAATIGGTAVHRTSISGQISRMVELPVLTRMLRRGEPIEADDIQWLEMRDQRLPGNAILDAEQLIGLTPRRSLRPGVPILTSDVRPPLLIERGGTVTLVLETPAMTLTAVGQALQDGALGDVVRIANLQSRSVVSGEITAAGTVRVNGAPAGGGN